MDYLYDFFFSLAGPLCHQITERSFQSFDGKQFFVCARDTGTYLGFFFSFLLSYKKFYKKEFNIPIVPIAILFLFHLFLFGLDGVSSYAGWRETNNFIRYFTGFYVGFFLGIIFQYVEKFFEGRIEINEKKSELIVIPFLLEIFATLLFFITLVSIKYLLYLLAFAIIFYIYKLIRLIVGIFFLHNRNFYYYLTIFTVFLLFLGSIFIAGVYKINIVRSFYH